MGERTGLRCGRLSLHCRQGPARVRHERAEEQAGVHVLQSQGKDGGRRDNQGLCRAHTCPNLDSAISRCKVRMFGRGKSMTSDRVLMHLSVSITFERPIKRLPRLPGRDLKVEKEALRSDRLSGDLSNLNSAQELAVSIASPTENRQRLRKGKSDVTDERFWTTCRV